MKILLLAPQPFFQERGTPIAVRLALEVIAKRRTDRVELLTYGEGQDIELPGVTIHRMKAPRCLEGVAPGVSFKKLLCDLFFAIALVQLLFRSRNDQFDLIHAVEEAAFLAWFVKITLGIPYVYDMDSSLSLQLTESWPIARPLKPLFEFLERAAIRGSTAVVPVCDALAAVASGHGAPDMQIVRDISLLKPCAPDESAVLRQEAQLPDNVKVVLYVGNLERYQGIDLLIESFSIVAKHTADTALIVVGGSEFTLQKYRSVVAQRGLQSRVHLLGPRPVSKLSTFLSGADILVSPRIKGNNTPMKVYSYLHAGKPLVATRLSTHTQVMDDSVAVLTEPTPEAFAAGILTLLRDPARAHTLASAAHRLAEERYTFTVFERDLNAIYDRIAQRHAPTRAVAEPG